MGWIRASVPDQFGDYNVGWYNTDTKATAFGEQPPSAASFSRGMTPQQFRQLKSNLGAGLTTPLVAVNPATGRPERVYVQMGIGENGMAADQAYFFESDAGRPADAQASFAGGYSTDNSNDFLGRVGEAASNIASNPAAQFAALTGGQGGMTAAQAATGGDVGAGAQQDLAALGGAATSAAAAPLLGATGAGALGGGAAGAIGTGGDIEGIAKGAALGGALGAASSALSGGGAPLSESAALENALSGATGAAGGMPAGATALPSAIAANPSATLPSGGSSESTTLGPATGTKLPAGTSASGATSSPVSQQAPAVAADLPVAPPQATLSESAGLENALSGGTGASGGMPAGAEPLPSAVSALSPDAASSLGISGTIPQLSESAAYENALSGGTGAAGGMPQGATPLPSAEPTLSPEAASVLGVGPTPTGAEATAPAASGGSGLKPAPNAADYLGAGGGSDVPLGTGIVPGGASAETLGAQTGGGEVLGSGISSIAQGVPAPTGSLGALSDQSLISPGAMQALNSAPSFQATADSIATPTPPAAQMPPAIQPPAAVAQLPPAVQSIFKQLGDNALALGLIGAAFAAAPGKSQIPNEQQLQGLGEEAKGVAKQLIDQYQSGQLTATQQAQLDRLMRNAKNQLNNYFASIGQSDSTAHALALELIDEQGLSMQQQMLDTALQNGLAALGVAQGPLNTIAQYQLGQDQALRNAYAQFAGSLGNLFGRSSAAPIQVNVPAR